MGEYLLVEDPLGNQKTLEWERKRRGGGEGGERGSKFLMAEWRKHSASHLLFLLACVDNQAPEQDLLPGQAKIAYLVFCRFFSLGTGQISSLLFSG